MKKRVLLAGASGAIGQRLAPLLVANGWRVVGTTRSPQKVARLREMGVEAAVLDVFDAAGLGELMAGLRPEIVIHQLTDLPDALEESKMADALVRTARLRDEGTRNLVEAAVRVGVRRFIAQSIAFIYAEGERPYRETAPLLPASHPVEGTTVAGVMSLERQVMEAPLEGFVLRYGSFYGPGTGFDRPTEPGSVHVDAAAKATERAVTRGPRGIYNVTDRDGAVSSDKAVRAFGWSADWRADR